MSSSSDEDKNNTSDEMIAVEFDNLNVISPQIAGGGKSRHDRTPDQ